jgi:HEAT repeat protein
MVRAVAVWHLGRWFEREDVRQAVLEVLRDKDKFVRGWALKLVTRKRYAQALPQVGVLLESEDGDVRYDAVHALARLRGPESVSTLERIVQADPSPRVRECAVRACTVVEPPEPRTAEVMIRALSDEHEEVRRVAARLLRKGFDQAFGFRATGTLGDREQAIVRWREWYAGHAEALQWDPERRVFAPRAGDEDSRSEAN